MKTQQSIISRIGSVIGKAIFLLLTALSWSAAAVAVIVKVYEVALGFAILGLILSLSCRIIRPDAGLIAFLFLSPVAAPLAVMQEADDNKASEMKTQRSIVSRIANIIIKTIFVLCAIVSWAIAIVIFIAGYPLYAFVFVAFTVVCVLLCKIRAGAGLILFLCLCPIALPFALKQKKDDDEES